MKNIYDLSIKRDKNEVLFNVINEYDYLKLFKGVIQQTEPLKVEVSEGKKFYDVLGFQDTANFAVSKRVLDLLRENNISGFNYYQLEILYFKELYYGIQITGKCGKIIEPNEPGFYIGYRYDENSWDGKDIFSPEDSALVFINEKLKHLFVVNKVSNLIIKNISKIEAFAC